MTSTIIRRTLAGVALAALASVSLSARTLMADIPFAFAVSNRTLPAGQYTLSDAGAQHMMLIRNRRTGDAAFVLARPNTLAIRGGENRLAFSGCKTLCRLSEIKPTDGASQVTVPVIAITQ